MRPPVAYDVTRLFLGPLSRTPRGIDRVDLAFAEHVFGARGGSLAILPTPWGVRCFDRERVLAGLARLRALWAETATPEADPVYRALRARLLEQPADESQRRPRESRTAGAARLFSLLRATGIAPGAAVRRSVPERAVYVNVGQIALAAPVLLRWLDRRRDVAPIFMLHDAIPLETPELVEPRGAWAHANMLDAAARRARGMIVTTQTAALAVEAELRARGAADLPTFARALPAPDAFGPHVTADPALENCAYFVACATLEPRKNLELLGEIWKRLCAAHGREAPHLVIVGAKGFTGARIAERLSRAPSTAGRVHIVHGLSTPGLARLVAGARALLSPSLIEGFGLPVVEAQALGTPAIAADIPSHREIARAGTTLIDPLDGPGWQAAIERAARESRPHRRHAGESWSAYFTAFDDWLCAFAGGDEPRRSREALLTKSLCDRRPRFRSRRHSGIKEQCSLRILSPCVCAGVRQAGASRL